jgi:acyl-CoA synthetase (AMP-forming)/AMP-acid ligase II
MRQNGSAVKREDAMSADPSLWRGFVSLSDTLAETARAAPSRPALIDDSRSLTYGELDALADRVAASLQRDGVAPRATLAIVASACVEYLALVLGALRAGIVVAPLSPSSTPASLAAMVADCGAQRLFVDATTREVFAAGELRIPVVALDDAGDGETLSSWLAPAGARPAPVAVPPDWTFNTIYSSGTTGIPKGIDQPHGMRWLHAKRASRFGYVGDAVTLVSTPLYSNTTLVSVVPALAGGGTLVLMKKFEAREFLRLAESHRVTHAMLVPVQYRRIMALPDFDNFDLASFRMKFSTSAPFPAALKRDVLDRWPGGLVEYYGMTEGGGTCVLVAHEHPDKLHTVGQPADGHDIRVIDEAGRELPHGEVGEVVGHSGASMIGYHNQPQATQGAEWRDASGKRFIRTGDVGRVDADGFMTLLDRRKDMIISGGFNIYPSDLEAVLGERRDIGEASVVGVPSKSWGETPVAFVAPAPGSTLDPEELRDWANARLGKTQRLSAVRLIDRLPRSPIGKVLKRELREVFGEAD